MTQFQVKKDNIGEMRLVALPDAALEEGEVRLKVDRFAFTANNVTYGVAGERIGYWKFFPAEDGWGVIPVWGFADVIESRTDAVPVGDRLYGYFPMGATLTISPGKISDHRLIDFASHRAELPPVYNTYMRVKSQPDYDSSTDDERMLLFPLYATSFCLYDFLLDNNWFDADQIVVISASSKTAIGLAYALAGDDKAPAQVGLTSTRNEAFVKELELYDGVVTYDSLTDIDAEKPTVIIDMSGNGDVLGRLHRHLGDNMRYCSNVGVTHWEDNKMGEGFIRERSAMFFAPSHIQKRATDWGSGEFEKRAFAFWQDAAVKSRHWLNLMYSEGLSGFETTYQAVKDGAFKPSDGMIVKM